MLRWILTLTFIALAGMVTLLAFDGRTDPKWSGLWLNLGTEIFGIVITVALVEWLFERRRLRDEAVKMAWRILHDVDHAVWVWQGGRRGFDFDELVWLLMHVHPDDPLPQFTQNLLMRIGSASDHTLRHDSAMIRAAGALGPALRLLSRLAAIRDASAPLAPLEIAELLLRALDRLALVVNRPLAAGIPTVDVQADSSESQQEWRHFGTPPPDPAPERRA